MFYQCARIAILGGVLLATFGCSGALDTASLHGEVSLDGEAISEGLITFTPLESDKGTSSSTEITNGQYKADDVPFGRVLVRFHAMKETGKTFTEFGKEYPETVSIIPKKYDLGEEIVVQAGEMSRDFHLTSR